MFFFINELFTIKALRKLRLFMRKMPLRGFEIIKEIHSSLQNY